MTETVLKEIVHRAVRDGSYRAQLQSDPAGALAGFSLTSEERAAIASADPARLTALGIDQRMSKAFAAGVLGDASKVIVIDGGVGGSVIDEAAATVRSPMWRIEQDLDTSATAAVSDEVIEGPATTHSREWRLEQDLDAGDSLKTVDGSADQPASDVQLTEY